ncbi:hypothetical protein NDU88_002553 [Pleurodeles waltl]|uniref:Uncharacterized protein n=1 Tax=Pleurodeles waltl TaxID=8319 RepID=A0AAV7W362_PLEWA|nr:hypothetical protein NDU88_002553 [Pleurodeles waltl]
MSKRRRARMRYLQVGDVVLLKNRHSGGKFQTLFEPKVWTVTRVKGTLITAMRKNETVTRNISWFKLYHGKPRESERLEVSNEPCLGDEESVITGPVQAGEDSEERYNTSLTAPDRREERIGAEVPSAEVTSAFGQRGGMDRYSLRPRTSAPEKLKDYVSIALAIESSSSGIRRGTVEEREGEAATWRLRLMLLWVDA